MEYRFNYLSGNLFNDWWHYLDILYSMTNLQAFLNQSEKELEIKFAPVQTNFPPRGGEGQDKWVCKLDEFGRITPHSLETIRAWHRSQQRALIRLVVEMIEGKKKAIKYPTLEHNSRIYNAALSDLQAELLKIIE